MFAFINIHYIFATNIGMSIRIRRHVLYKTIRLYEGCFKRNN